MPVNALAIGRPRRILAMRGDGLFEELQPGPVVHGRVLHRLAPFERLGRRRPDYFGPAESVLARLGRLVGRRKVALELEICELGMTVRDGLVPGRARSLTCIVN